MVPIRGDLPAVLYLRSPNGGVLQPVPSWGRCLGLRWPQRIRLKLKGHRHEIQWICTERLPNRWLQRVRMGQVHGSKNLLLEISFAVQSTEQKQAAGA